MEISEEILVANGAIVKKFKKGDFIFHEGDFPRFYYQIIEGKIKLFNINMDGKEFTQLEFKKGRSFGEPPIFINEKYPCNAKASMDSSVLKLSVENFLEFLSKNPIYQNKLIELFAKRIYNKAITAKEIINNTSPKARIVWFFNDYKKKNFQEGKKIEIPFTRQEIANFTGLRVETVIRTLIKMNTNKIVQIVEHKIIF